MTDFKGDRPRLSLSITREQAIDLQNLVPWGAKNAIFRNIIDDMIKILKSPLREVFLAGMLSRDIHLEDFVKEVNKLPLSSKAEGVLDSLREERYLKEHKDGKD